MEDQKFCKEEWEIEGQCEDLDCVNDGYGGEESFRDSFYNGGTDWSCLYSVDEYGLPYVNDEDAPFSSRHGDNDNSLIGSAGNAYELSIQEGQRRKETFNSSHSSETLFKRYTYTSGVDKQGSFFKQPKLAGKLVQTNLFSFIGRQKSENSQDNDEVELEHAESALEKRTSNANDISSFVARFNQNKAGEALVQYQKTKAFGNAVPKERVTGYGVRSFQTPRACPFYKKIPGTSFTVDAFRYGAIDGCSGYFLSHFHSDHYGGLSKGWCHGPIYCTTVTARLLVLCLSVNARWICPIQLGVMQVIEGVEVTLLDANHCPGAAIIHFKLQNGQNILHTGDFRACMAMQKYPELLGRISILYLDTTYCNPRYRFPGQKEVINFVVEIVRTNIQRNSKVLVVVGAYSIGKEKVYLGIAQALGVRIFVDCRRRRLLSSLDWYELESKLCTDENATMLHVLPIGHLRVERLKAYLKSFQPKFSAILAFRPTGWTYSEKVGDNLKLLRPSCSGPVTIYGVPYSEHSSYVELQEFVKFLQPQSIIPTVNVGSPKERERMKALFKQWLIK